MQVIPAEPEAQFKCFKLGQVRGKARSMVPTPLQEQARSAVTLPHVAVDVCRAGSSFCLTIDHVIHRDKSPPSKRADWLHEHKCMCQELDIKNVLGR